MRVARNAPHILFQPVNCGRMPIQFGKRVFRYVRQRRLIARRDGQTVVYLFHRLADG